MVHGIQQEIIPTFKIICLQISKRNRVKVGFGRRWSVKLLPFDCISGLMLLPLTAAMTVKMGKENVGLLALANSAQQWKGPYWNVRCNTLLFPVLPPF